MDDVAPILASLNAAGWPLFLALGEVWYRAGTSETGVRQFLVQDPDGYLVRFSQGLGLRPAMRPTFHSQILSDYNGSRHCSLHRFRVLPPVARGGPKCHIPGRCRDRWHAGPERRLIAGAPRYARYECSCPRCRLENPPCRPASRCVAPNRQGGRALGTRRAGPHCQGSQACLHLLTSKPTTAKPYPLHSVSRSWSSGCTGAAPRH